MSKRPQPDDDDEQYTSPRKRRKTTTGSRKFINDQLELKVDTSEPRFSEYNEQNWFGYAWISLKLIMTNSSPEHEIVTDAQHRISPTLVFSNGEPVPDDVNMETKPSTIELINGECEFEIKISTLSMYHENRAFKLIFNVLNPPSKSQHNKNNNNNDNNNNYNNNKFIRPLESHAFKLVKHRLEIFKEPAERFYKDEGGRNNCLSVCIHLKDCHHKIEESRDKIPLNLRLVYDDNSQAQSQRDILEVLTQNVEIKNGVCSVDFRINEVSKNHNKRAFRLVVECASDNALYHDISGVMTRPVMVFSKRTKKGRRGSPAEVTSGTGITNVTTISSTSTSVNTINPINNNNLITKRLKPNVNENIGNALIPKVEQSDNASHFIPSAMTGLLPSIQAGILPNLPNNLPFSAQLKQINHSSHNNPNHNNMNANNINNNHNHLSIIKKERVDNHQLNNRGAVAPQPRGVFHTMMDWCQSAEWVMKILEWVHCGYEFDPISNMIDTNRPLYRCCYCLRYRNCAGSGTHEKDCQLKHALDEYNDKVKGIHQSYTYQHNLMIQDPLLGGDMPQLDHAHAAPNNNNNNNNNPSHNHTHPVPGGITGSVLQASMNLGTGGISTMSHSLVQQQQYFMLNGAGQPFVGETNMNINHNHNPNSNINNNNNNSNNNNNNNSNNSNNNNNNNNNNTNRMLHHNNRNNNANESDENDHDTNELHTRHNQPNDPNILLSAAAASFGLYAQPPLNLISNKEKEKTKENELYSNSLNRNDNHTHNHNHNHNHDNENSQSSLKWQNYINRVESVCKQRSDYGWAAFDDSKNLLGYFDDKAVLKPLHELNFESSTGDFKPQSSLVLDDFIFRNDSGTFIDEVRRMISGG